MDPDKTLEQIREVRADLMDVLRDDPQSPRIQHLSEHLAVLIESLDSWLTSGGFLPEDWASSIVMGR